MCVCDPLVKDGYEYVEWMAQFFHACAWTPEDQASFFLGLANIGFWLFAQVFTKTLWFLLIPGV